MHEVFNMGLVVRLRGPGARCRLRTAGSPRTIPGGVLVRAGVVVRRGRAPVSLPPDPAKTVSGRFTDPPLSPP